jgi:hypothetical protein
MSRERDMAEAIARLEAQEEEFDATGAEDDRSYTRARTAVEPSQVYSVRVPTQLLQDLRQAAERRAMTPSALMRQWVIDKLAEEDRPIYVVTRAVPAGSSRDDTEAVLGLIEATTEWATRTGVGS